MLSITGRDSNAQICAFTFAISTNFCKKRQGHAFRTLKGDPLSFFFADLLSLISQNWVKCVLNVLLTSAHNPRTYSTHLRSEDHRAEWLLSLCIRVPLLSVCVIGCAVKRGLSFCRCFSW